MAVSVALRNQFLRAVLAVAGGLVAASASAHGSGGLTGYRVLATTANLNQSIYVALDANNTLHIVDPRTNAVLSVFDGTIQTVVGIAAKNGAQLPATTAQLNAPWGIATLNNVLHFTDRSNNKIRVVGLTPPATSAGR